MLGSAGMDPDDVVKLTYILTWSQDVPAFREAWDRVLRDHRPASTILIVAALGRPVLLVEIEAVAAKA